MKADVRYVRDGLSAQAKYDQINMMPVSYEEFATTSALFARAYGVITGEAQQGYTGPNRETLVSYVLNRCARSALYEQLLKTTQDLERLFGYKLSSRYMLLGEPWRGNKIALPIPGATALEVERAWYYTDLLVAPDYYIQEGITLFLDGDTLIARVSAELFENPKWAILRRRDNHKNLNQDTSHARYGEYDAGDWLIPLATNTVAVVLADTIDAAHRRYVRLTVPKPLPVIADLPADAVFTPVYPGSNQIIPHEVISEDDDEIVYQFEVWLLVNPAFAEETVNWESAKDIYKFYREITFAYYAEVPAYLELIWTSGTCTTVYQYDPDDPDQATLPRLTATLADSSKSIVHLKANNALVTDLDPYWRACCEDDCGCDTMPLTVTLKLKYKVEPQALPARLYDQIDDLETAIVHRVAAELPTADCGCELPDMGFIYENQLPYQDSYSNPFTGVEIVKRKYGTLHGQMVYSEKLENKQVYRRPIRLGYW